MKPKFENTFIKAAISVVIMTEWSVPCVLAQQEDETETITVSGVRSNIAASLATKKNAKFLIDSITAKELGRFPADNFADSQSQISGITVSRTQGGETQNVIFRGFGPELSIVTLNNRILATDDGGGRSFSFDVIPSETINRADVWKTVQARNIEGSVGAAVNLKSTRAIDPQGRQGIVSVTDDETSYGVITSNEENLVALGSYALESLSPQQVQKTYEKGYFKAIYCMLGSRQNLYELIKRKRNSQQDAITSLTIIDNQNHLMA